MDENEKLSLSLYGIVTGIKDTLSLPTHTTLEKTLVWSLILSACSGVSELLGFYCFISWQGSVACSIFLVALYLIERRENNALSTMYRNARVLASKAKRRTKGTSSSGNSGRSTKRTNSPKQKTGKRKQQGNHPKNS